MRRTLALAAFGLFGQAQAFFEEGSKVALLTDDDFEDYVAQNNKFMAMFYAPWCGHCKNMKPEYAAAAEDLQYKSTSMVAVDCTEQKATCGKYGVTAYPSVKWFEAGEADDYKGGREKQAMVNFITDKVGDEPENFEGVDFSKMRVKELKRILHSRGIDTKGISSKKEIVKLVEENHHLPTGAQIKTQKRKKKKGKSSLVNGRTFAQERKWKAALKVAEEGFGEDNGEVKHAIEDDWAKFREEHPQMFVMFYAPWCGHCKAFKPEFIQASKDVKETDPTVQFVGVECETNPELCKKQGATAYPTVKYYADATDNGQAFNGGRNAKGIATYLTKLLRPDDYTPEPFVNDINKWEENGEVVHLTDDHFDDYKTDKNMLVMFYAPWCGHCKAMKPDFAKASEEASGSIEFVAVDCTTETLVCGKFDVKGFPTMKYLSADGGDEDYNMGRDLASMVAFAREKAGEVPQEEKAEL